MIRKFFITWATTLSVTSFATAASYSDTVLSVSGLQAYYRMNEHPAAIGDKLVNTAAPGTLEGTWGYVASNNSDFATTLPTSGQAGPAPADGFRGLEANNHSAFFGGNEVEQIADQMDLGAPIQFDNEFATISFFMKTNVQGNDGRLFTTAPNATHTFRLIYGTLPDYGGIAVITDGTHASPAAGRITSGTNFADNVWHHIVVVRDGDNALNSRFYIDGQDISGNYKGIVTGFGASDASARIGARFGANPTDWGGYEGGLDEFAYWNRALSPTEVAALYDSAVGAVYGDLNQDGSVDAADAGLLFGNWGAAGGIGDLNQDFIVDAADAGELFGAWTGDSMGVPEPSSIWLCAGLGCAVLRARRPKA